MGPHSMALTWLISACVVPLHGTRSLGRPTYDTLSRATGVVDSNSAVAWSPSEIGTGEVVSVTLRLQFHPVVSDYVHDIGLSGEGESGWRGVGCHLTFGSPHCRPVWRLRHSLNRAFWRRDTVRPPRRQPCHLAAAGQIGSRREIPGQKTGRSRPGAFSPGEQLWVCVRIRR